MRDGDTNSFHDVDVAIVGAGPAGLTAAYLLTRQKKRVVVIERDPHYVGGISRTVRHKEFRFDIGGHRFFSKSRDVVRLWEEMLPNEFVVRPRMSRILYDGKFYSYPLRGLEALRNLGISRSAACMRSYAKATLFPRRPVRSFEDWTINRFGYELYSIFFKTYTEKVWGMPCNEISADWAAQRIQSLSLGRAVADGIKRSLGLSKLLGSENAPKTLIDSFRYPRLGPGMLWEAAREKVEASGGIVEMGFALGTLTRQPGAGRWALTASHHNGASVSIAADHVISSAPLVELLSCMTPAPRVLEHARRLRYRDFLTVALLIKGDDPFPDNWIYIHDPRVKVGRIQNYRSWSPDMAPPGDVGCVGLEYFCFENDGLWKTPDNELVALAKREVSLLGLCSPERVVEGVVVRQPKAYPVYDDGYADIVAAIRDELADQYPTLHPVGRNGMHRYNNQDHSMLTALLTVCNINAGAPRYDVWRVNDEADYHEAGQEGEREIVAIDPPHPTRAHGTRHDA
jgi:protoporphyrinogen oxidase